MSLDDILSRTAAALGSARGSLGDLLTPTVRLGVTGLARSGKTVFITALVRNLVAGGRLPSFTAQKDGRLLRAYLEPQSHLDVPRFDYEGHLNALAADPPEWPESTKRIAELRVTLEFETASPLRRTLGISRLHLDIVDYPGEWLIDLPMLEPGCDYARWSREALALAREPVRARAAEPFLARLTSLDPASAHDEMAAQEAARLFTRYLQDARSGPSALSVAGPGRFLMPGDLEGSPLLTFVPLDGISDGSPAKGSLAEQMAQRFEAYKRAVVQPFFKTHFSRLDRQIVLVDALHALNAGREGLNDLERAISAVMRAFRPGTGSWLDLLLGRRLDRILFAATKADHLHRSSHERLQALLETLAGRAAQRASGAGAEVRCLAMAALRATREAEAKHGNERLPCIVGTPLPGESIDGTVFDGRKEAAIFPGDLPREPGLLLDPTAAIGPAGVSVVRFRPPRLDLATGAGGEAKALPHVHLDKAIEYLIGDRLA